MDNPNLVTAPNGGEVSSETLSAGQVPQGGTLPTSASEADKKIQELKDKYEHDISSLKSTFQRGESELKRQMEEQRRQYDEHVRQLKLSKMDEVERKKFEEQEILERNRNYEEELRKAQQALMEKDQKEQYRDFFSSVGVTPQELDNTGDLSTLVNSGYAAWMRKTKAMEKKIAELEKKAQAASGEEEVKPPEVNTTKGTPTKGPTWPDLIKKYGSAERVYRLVETGQLPPSILPKE